jgi:hypothetical protein
MFGFIYKCTCISEKINYTASLYKKGLMDKSQLRIMIRYLYSGYIGSIFEKKIKRYSEK